jgi:hypothetical protein
VATQSSTPRRPPLRSIVLLLACAVGLAGTACSDGEPAGDAERFCGEVNANVRALTKPKLRSGADVNAYVELYRQLGEVAPLAVEEDWAALTDLYETASTVDTSSAESRDELNELAFRTEQSAVDVKRWLKANCNVNLPVTTIVDHDVKVPVSTTSTLPG